MQSLSCTFDTEEVFIIGGGPSLAGFDFERLRDKATIGCNAAAFRAEAKVVFSVDQPWMNMHSPQLAEYPGEVVVACHTWEQFDRHPYCTRRYIHERDSRMSEGPPYLRGLNSGHAAVNLAALEGFKTIHLLGIDMHATGHWHEGYAWSRQSHETMRKWAMDLDLAKPTLDRMGVTVLNYSPCSACQAYPKRDLRDI